MAETYSPNKELRILEIARDLFSQLLSESYDYPSDVIIELEKNLLECESKIHEQENDLSESRTQISELKNTHYIWTRGLKKRQVTESDIEHYKKTKILFVDDDKMHVYSNGKKIIEYGTKHKRYNILRCLLMNNGSASVKKIFKEYEYRRNITKIAHIEKILRPSASRIRTELKKSGIVLKPFRGPELSLDEKIDFVLAKRI